MDGLRGSAGLFSSCVSLLVVTDDAFLSASVTEIIGGVFCSLLVVFAVVVSLSFSSGVFSITGFGDTLVSAGTEVRANNNCSLVIAVSSLLFG